MVCQSCGGIVGRDCFNPQECMWITQQMLATDSAAQIQRQAEDAIWRQYQEWCEEQHEQHLAEQAGFDPIALGM